MDFNLSEEQAALRDLAHQVFTTSTSVESMELIAASHDRFDRALWATLAETGLLGVVVPESYGGLGFGVFEAGLVLEGYGHSLSPMPLEETLASALVLARFGTEEQQARLLPGIAAGEVVVVMAMEEWGINDPTQLSVTGAPVDDGLRISGSKPAVGAVADATTLLVPVQTADGVLFALVDPNAAGVSLRTNETTNHQLQSDVSFDDVHVSSIDLLPGGTTALPAAIHISRVLSGAVVLGACDQAVELTVEHANNREQFGKPIATNQAYSQRLADASIAIDCIRLTTHQAAWKLDEGADAEEEVLVAAWWAADGGSQVVHSTQHLHGSAGADVSYPVHRQYLAVKQRANTLGSASSHLAELGKLIAS